MTRQRVVVIGGGAAGLMAAGEASRAGADTLLLEKMRSPGRKLAITGKGRCNLTNVAELPDFIEHFSESGRFLRQAFSSFFAPELMAFFEALGLELVTERGGRVFPASGSAPDVLKVLVKWVKDGGVRIKNSSAVVGIETEDGRLTGVVTEGGRFPCDAAILATGGASYPETGSTGDGYLLARSAGHSIVNIRPALVPLDTAGPTAGRMAGLNLINVGVKTLRDGVKFQKAFGEMGFSGTGAMGPVINTLSGRAVDAMRAGHEITLSIDLKPALDEKKLDKRILRDFSARPGEPMNSVLRALLPREMIAVCLDETGISPAATPSSITAVERKRLRGWLKDLRLEVTGHRPIEEAIVTAGGVETREVDPRTMESRLLKGLYMAGEVMDIQADTGGYNLQAAFSTGWVAARAAAGVKE